MAKDEQQGEQVFNRPRITINRVYTKQGDAGLTRLVGGQQIPKHDLRIETYGTIDELNSFLGAARQTLLDEIATGKHPNIDPLTQLAQTLLRVQHELFNLGSILATLPEDIHPRQPRVTSAEIELLEREIDDCQAQLSTLRSFVLPGGSRLNADLHICRTVCRRAERHAVALAQGADIDPLAITYLNRLSDALFVWSRWASHLLHTPEILWEPNRAASALAATPENKA